MNFNIIAVPAFKRQLKRLVKKYPSLKKDLEVLFNLLQTNPTQGTSLGRNCYKIRLSITSKGKGKSGGARIITNFVFVDATVYLLFIYYKSEKASLTNKELIELLNNIPQ